jgi:large subunit ribosomal protein L15
MMLHEINAGRVVVNKDRKRVGRGESSGQGKTSGRGSNGQGQRAGSGPIMTHEGGGLPYYRKMPKRGFNNFLFRKEYVGINIGTLDRIFEAGAVVDREALLKAKLIEKKDGLVKILATGKLTKSLTVKIQKFSKAAEEAIKSAGGQVEVVS